MADIYDTTTHLRLVLWCDPYGTPWGVGRTTEQARTAAHRIMASVPVDDPGYQAEVEVPALLSLGFAIVVEAPAGHIARIVDLLTGDREVVALAQAEAGGAL